MGIKFTFARASQIGLSGVAAVLGAIACAQTAPELTPSAETEIPATAPKVVVTTSVLCDLTEQIAENSVNLTCLLRPSQDPHTYQAKPADRLAVDEADLVLYDGYNFAPAVIGLVESSNSSAPKVAVYEAAVPDPLMGQGHDHDHDDHDHDTVESSEPVITDDHEDHDHAEAEAEEAASATTAAVADPHIWHDAENNGAIAAVIADELAKVNPEQAEQYQQKAAQLQETFVALDDWIQRQTETIPTANRYLVTTHDSFRYFADAYGLEVKGALAGLSTQAQPSAKVLTDLAAQVKAAQVPAIFAESTTNPELINTIARDAAVKVADQPLFVEGPGTDDSAAPSVQAMLVVNTCTIVNALGGTCDATQAPLE